MSTIKTIARAVRGEVIESVEVEKTDDVRRCLFIKFESGNAMEFTVAGEGLNYDLSTLKPKDPSSDSPLTADKVSENTELISVVLNGLRSETAKRTKPRIDEKEKNRYGLETVYSLRVNDSLTGEVYMVEMGDTHPTAMQIVHALLDLPKREFPHCAARERYCTKYLTAEVVEGFALCGHEEAQNQEHDFEELVSACDIELKIQERIEALEQADPNDPILAELKALQDWINTGGEEEDDFEAIADTMEHITE